MSTADQLEKLANLLREGLITREEFDQEKQKLLSVGSSASDSDRTSFIGSQTAKWAVLGLLGLGVLASVWMWFGEDEVFGSITEEETNLKSGKPTKVTVKGVDFTLSYAPSGTFVMGSEKDAKYQRFPSPAHKVTLTQGYYISTTEVTQGLYAAVTGGHPWRDKPNGNDWDAGECYHFGEMAQGESQPAVCVSWYDAVTFCNALSELEGLEPAYDISGTIVKRVAGASGYRLPTEAEWEYAARAAESHTYAGSNNVNEVAWYWENSRGQTHPVGQKNPNAWGLYDMSGNVSEWTGDWKGDYPTGSVTDPQGPSTGGSRANRGGSWGDPAFSQGAAVPEAAHPLLAIDKLGFRVVLPA